MVISEYDILAHNLVEGVMRPSIAQALAHVVREGMNGPGRVRVPDVERVVVGETLKFSAEVCTLFMFASEIEERVMWMSLVRGANAFGERLVKGVEIWGDEVLPEDGMRALATVAIVHKMVVEGVKRGVISFSDIPRGIGREEWKWVLAFFNEELERAAIFFGDDGESDEDQLILV